MATHKYYDTLNLHVSPGKSEWNWLTKWCACGSVQQTDRNLILVEISGVAWPMTGLFLGRNSFLFLRAGNTCRLFSHSDPWRQSISTMRPTCTEGHERPLHWCRSAHLPKSQTMRQVLRAWQWWSASPLSSSCLGYPYIHTHRGNNTAQGGSCIHFNGKRKKKSCLGLSPTSHSPTIIQGCPASAYLSQWSLRMDFRGRVGWAALLWTEWVHFSWPSRVPRLT